MCSDSVCAGDVLQVRVLLETPACCLIVTAGTALTSDCIHLHWSLPPPLFTAICHSSRHMHGMARYMKVLGHVFRNSFGKWGTLIRV